MSPLSIRRYRAERLLRADFERLRGTVIALAERRLRAADACLDRSDLDAAYSQAWHGLYAAVLEGREIDNPAGWLATVTFRRAVDEHRSRSFACGAAVPFERATARGLISDRPERQAAEPDLASALDDRIRLRRLMEGLRTRLSGRELEAASLCYLQGLPRAQAAARMGVSDAAMRRLMDGRRGRPGVARKFGSLVGAVDSGDWCAEQGSLMRGLAYGILDPKGQRYQLAVSHHRECPACRSYVLSLRGLAAVLPPAPLLVRLALLASSGAGAGTGASAATGTAGAGAAGTGTGAAGAGAGGGVAGAGGGAVSATGAAGGGLLIAGAGPAATKLAVGCLLALGVGAGCVALGGAGDHAQDAAHAHVRVRASRAGVRARAAAILDIGSSALGGAVSAPARTSARAAAAPGASEHAPREFGPEIGGAAGETSGATPEAQAPRAVTAAAKPSREARASATPHTSAPAPGGEASAGAAAAREFSPG